MRRAVPVGEPVVVKVGSSSLSNAAGGIDDRSVERVVSQIAHLVASGYPAVLVTSGAIAAGFPALGTGVRPTAIADLQVAAAVGQTKLMERYASLFRAHSIEVGQVLITRDVLGNRDQYLNARAAMRRMVELGVVPIVNENDTVAVDEVRLGDNDRLAAIASHLVHARMLVILTDTDGLYTADPKLDASAELLGAVAHSDAVLDQLRVSGGTGVLGSGGVATKVVAARMAAFSGIPTVIAPSSVGDAVERAVTGENIGTWVDAVDRPISSRKLWIAFGLHSAGSLTIDDGAFAALRDRGTSLLRVGVVSTDGVFEVGDAVEVHAAGSGLVGKGVTRWSAVELAEDAEASTGPVVHRDDLVMLT